jgi:hypothetical protein
MLSFAETVFINISPSATTEAEIADKAKLEFRKSKAILIEFNHSIF